jgi:6-phosphofructokinase 2
MAKIVTLTLNPSIDGSAEAEKVRHTNKVRTSNERFDPGGGGINVARVVKELGGDVCALYLAGGATGDVLDSLIDKQGVSRKRIPIADDTRLSHVVYERESGKEFRFTPEGPKLSEDEISACLDALREMDYDYLVASGSLPRGVDAGFYTQVADIARDKGAHFVLDTSGDALKAALEHGGIHLVKPSHGEFRNLTGKDCHHADEFSAAAKAFIDDGKAEMIAVTLGHEGAVLVDRDGAWQRDVPEVKVRSAVGAGDSFVAGMTWALSTGLSNRDAFLMGMAAGSAAVMTPGTELCRREDVERLYEELLEAGKDNGS